MSSLPIVMLPGLLCDEGLFAPQLRVLAPHGQAMVADLSQDDSLPAMARRVLEQAPAVFTLMGLSMGGYLAFEVLRQAPRRVARLALLSTSARPDTPEATALRHDMMALVRRGMLVRLQQEGYARSVHASRLQDEGLRQTLMDMAMELGPACFERQQQAIMARPDSRPMLAGIACPTLLMVGADDLITPPECTHEMAAAIPGAQLRILQRCGHISTLERPDEVNAALLAWLGHGAQA